MVGYSIRIRIWFHKLNLISWFFVREWINLYIVHALLGENIIIIPKALIWCWMSSCLLTFAHNILLGFSLFHFSLLFTLRFSHLNFPFVSEFSTLWPSFSIELTESCNFSIFIGLTLSLSPQTSKDLTWHFIWPILLFCIFCKIGIYCNCMISGIKVYTRAC